MEQASLRAKAAALREKMAIEQEEEDWHAEKRYKEVQLQAEEAEFEAHQKRNDASIKARKELHAMQTALAESDAKMEVLQKYENTQEDGSTVKTDDHCQTDTKPTLQPPSRPTLPAHRVKQNTPAATDQLAMSAPKTEIKEPQDQCSMGFAKPSLNKPTSQSIL